MAWFPAKVELAYGSSPASDPAAVTWTDVSTSVPGWNVGAGRNNEFDSIEASTCSFTLYNEDGSLTPGRDTTKNLVPWDYNISVGPRYAQAAADSAYWSTSFTATWTYAANFLAATVPASTANAEIYLNALGPLAATRVVAGNVYSANIAAWSDAASQSAYGFISWLDHDLVEISRSTSSTLTLGTSAAGSTDLTIANATAPAGAIYAVIGVRKTTTNASSQNLSVGFPSMQTGAVFTGRTTPPVIPQTGNLIRISVQDSTSTYRPVFTGAVESLEVQNEDGSQDMSAVVVTAVDAQKYLANIDLADNLRLANAALAPNLIVPLQDAGDSTLSPTGKLLTGLVYDGTNYSTSTTAAYLRRWARVGTSYNFGTDGPAGTLGVSVVGIDKIGGYYVNCDAATATASSTGSYTVQGWFRCNPATYQRAIFGITPGVASGNAAGPALIITSSSDTFPNQIMFDNQEGSTPGLLSTSLNPVNVTDNAWHHVAVTVTMSTSTYATGAVYLDGTWMFNIGINPASGTTWNTTGSLSALSVGWNGYNVGSQRNNALALSQYGAQFFTGDLSYWAIHSTALTADQISSLASVGQTSSAFFGLSELATLDKVLDAVGWPSAARNYYSPGKTVLGGVAGGSGSVMDAVKIISDSASSFSFIDESGKVAMASREARYYGSTTLTPSETSGTAQENDLTWSLDDTNLYTKTTVTGAGGGTVSVSISTPYGVREFPLDTALADSTAMSSLGYWLLYLHGGGQVRVGQITFLMSAAGPSTLWDTLLTWGLCSNKVMDLGSILRSQEPNLVTRYFVESFNWTYDQDSLTFSVTCDLSPAKHYENELLRLGDDQYGQLGLWALGL